MRTRRATALGAPVTQFVVYFVSSRFSPFQTFQINADYRWYYYMFFSDNGIVVFGRGLQNSEYREKSEKMLKKGVDNWVLVRYNGGSLSKSAFPTSTKRNGKRGRCFEVANGTSEYS